MLVVPDGTGAPREYTVTRGALRRYGVLAGALVVMSAVAGGAAAWRFAPAASGAVAGPDLSPRLRALDDTIARLAERDRRLRAYAGLLGPSDTANHESPTNDVDATLGTPRAFSRFFNGSVSAAGVSRSVDEMLHRATALSASLAVLSDTLATRTARFEQTPSIMPTAGWLTSNFSLRRAHPILHVSRPHEGIDVAAPMGAPIVAPAAARVLRVARETGYGLIVELDHGHGIVTRYAHCSAAFVRAGQRVTRGERIAAVGNSGLSTGPHLHYEIHVDGRAVDPLTFVLPNVVSD